MGDDALGLRLTVASSLEQFLHFTTLAREYIDSLGFPLTFQDVERELADAASEYGPPSGRAWLALAGGGPAGIVGVRRFDDTTAEIKRMYVRPGARGRGLGRMLASAAIDGAGDLGYRSVVLDTVAGMTGAIAIYRSLGFIEVEAYRYNPRPDAVYMRLDLPSR